MTTAGSGRPRPARKKVSAKAAEQPADKRLVDRITREVRDLILQNKIAPGTVLLQTEWSERLQVSRTPLREAFRILEHDGLVETSNGNRTVRVAQHSAEELRDLYEVRQVIDGLAARLLAERSVPEDVDEVLTRLLATMDTAADPFDPASWFSAHMNFHLRIAEACGSRQVRQQLDLIRTTSLSLHRYIADLPTSSRELRRIMKIAAKQHRAIYESIRSGDGAVAEATACEHIRTTIDSGLITSTTGS